MSTTELSTETIKDDDKGIDVTVIRQFMKSTTTKSSPSSATTTMTKENTRENNWFKTILGNTKWYRVRYKSARFGKECETPCWTAFYGGREEYKPYTPIPHWLKPLVDEVSSKIGVNGSSSSINNDENVIQFNAILLRLYFDGNDEIAWHTDGRTFLGNNPTICSLSFGADAKFEMRRMTNVWPPTNGTTENNGTDYVDRTTPQLSFVLHDGDLLVMKGSTQKHWHHRVPKQKGRRPRLNINFRYILPSADAERGQQTYYKYMVHGDEDKPKSFSFTEIMNQRGGMMKFLNKTQPTPTTTTSSKQQKPLPSSLKVHEPILASQIQQNDEIVSEDNCTSCDSNNIVSVDSCTEQTSAPAASSSLTPPDDESLIFLQSNKDIDESTFLSLPTHLRTELINEWKAQQRRRQQHQKTPFISQGGKRSNIITHNNTNAKVKRNCSSRREKNENNRKQNTIQHFFTKK